MIASLLAAAALSGCAASETTGAGGKVKSVKLDYAYYNPVSLVLKEKKWLEDLVKKDGIGVEGERAKNMGNDKSYQACTIRGFSSEALRMRHK
jgi:hypothetical protein